MRPAASTPGKVVVYLPLPTGTVWLWSWVEFREMAMVSKVLRARRRRAARFSGLIRGISAEFFVLSCAANGEFGAEPAGAGGEKW